MAQKLKSEQRRNSNKSEIRESSRFHTLKVFFNYSIFEFYLYIIINLDILLDNE